MPVGLYVPLLLSALWTIEPPPAPPLSPSLSPSPSPSPTLAVDEAGEVAAEPQGGAGISPVEIIPRIELRQSYLRLPGGVAVNATTPELDMQFFRRMLLRYQLPVQIVKTPAGQISGVGDVRLETLIVIASNKTSLVGAIAGVVLDTASQPQLGTGREQIFLGGGLACKPFSWWLLYGVAQELLSVGGSSVRPDVNQLALRAGTVVFGKQYNWFKLDVDTTVDLLEKRGRLFGTLEMGSLLVGRVGLFARAGTQLAGQRELDFALAAGLRYLFRLQTSKPRPGANPGGGSL
jgi:hypothetical protein